MSHFASVCKIYIQPFKILVYTYLHSEIKLVLECIGCLNVNVDQENAKEGEKESQWIRCHFLSLSYCKEIVS